MPAVATWVFAAASIALGAWLGRSSKGRRHAELLGEVTAQRGGHVESGSVPRLVATVDGVRVEVTLSTGKNQVTSYAAHVPPPGVPVFSLQPRGWLYAKPGPQDIAIDEAFDTLFVVKGADPTLVRRVWTTNLVLLARYFEGSRITSDGTVLRFEEPRVENADQIVQGIDFLVALAQSDPYGIAALTALPEAVMRREHRFPVAHIPGPQPILVGPIEEENGVARTCARTSATIAEIPAAARHLLVAIGDGKVEMTDTETRVCWSTIETDSRRLTAAIELLRTIAMGPSLGVFR